jgi:hypothetical protein
MPSADEKPKSNLGTATRVTGAFMFAAICALFILFWEVGFLPNFFGPRTFMGYYIYLPILAYVTSFCICLAIQQLSCGTIQAGVQAQRAALSVVFIPIVYLLLYLLPGLRWPVEGLTPLSPPPVKAGLSMAFFIFWGGLYTQEVLNGFAQICP